MTDQNPKPTRGRAAVAQVQDKATGIQMQVQIVVEVIPETTERWSSDAVGRLISETVDANVDIYHRGRK